jgi:hypothetical protein
VPKRLKGKFMPEEITHAGVGAALYFRDANGSRINSQNPANDLSPVTPCAFVYSRFDKGEYPDYPDAAYPSGAADNIGGIVRFNLPGGRVQTVPIVGQFHAIEVHGQPFIASSLDTVLVNGQRRLVSSMSYGGGSTAYGPGMDGQMSAVSSNYIRLFDQFDLNHNGALDSEDHAAVISRVNAAFASKPA